MGLKFEDSLLSSVESSLCTGPISFDCYPNFTVSLNNKTILKSLVLQVKPHNYEMIKGSIPIALIFTGLCIGPISYDCYPNFTVSLNDKNIKLSSITS